MTHRPSRQNRAATRGLQGLGACLWMLFLLPVSAAWGQADTDPGDAAEILSAEPAELESKLVEEKSKAEYWANEAKSFHDLRESFTASLESYDEAIQRMIETEFEPPPEWSELPLEQLEAELLSAEQQWLAATAKQTRLTREKNELPDRPSEIRRRQQEAKARLEGLQESPGGAGPGEELLVRARERALEAELAAYDAELAAFGRTTEIAGKKLELQELQVERDKAQMLALEKTFTQRWMEDAKLDSRRSQDVLDKLLLEIDEAHRGLVKTLVEPLVREHAELAEERARQKASIESRKTRRKVARAESHVAQLEADYQHLVEKLDAVRLSGQASYVGQLLRKQRTELPDARLYRRYIAGRQDDIRDINSLRSRWDEARRSDQEVEWKIEELMETLREAKVVEASDCDSTPTRQPDRIVCKQLKALFKIQQKFVDRAVAEYEDRFQSLVDLTELQGQLIAKIHKLSQLIDGRALWFPSGDVVNLDLPAPAREAVSEWLTEPVFVRQLATALAGVFGVELRKADQWPKDSSGVLSNVMEPVAYAGFSMEGQLLNAFVVLAFLAIVTLRGPLVRRLQHVGALARAPSCTRTSLTWEAFGISLLLATCWAGLLYFVGWRLLRSPDATQFVRCVAYGTTSAALVWLSLAVPRQLLSDDGVIEAHFGGPDEAVRRLRRHVTWLMIVAVPSVFIVQVMELRGHDSWRESLGRLAFAPVMLAAVFFLHSTLREGRGAMWSVAAESPDQPIRPWIQRALHFGSVAVCCLLVAAAAVGYYWTANQLATSFHFTLVFAFLLLMLYRLALRWSRISGRRILIEQQEAEAKAADGSGDGHTTGTFSLADLDIEAIDARTAHMIKSLTVVAGVLGTWLIWGELLPGLGSMELWSTVQDGVVVPVSLADLLFAVVLAGLTFALVQNLPGLLEITAFARLAPGERYAYATLAKYGIGLVGAAVVFSAVGIGWGNIQWLVAGVGVGLGFGLQEIFANFVSGLIILFERPIRVGDTVTVGNISGVVSKIRIRATWIMGFDRKELVVPNKEFVTSQLVNWSLSDPLVRLNIPVGIAYGSDTEKAIEILRRVAAENDWVKEEPAPEVLFVGFGPSSLDFELRCFSPNPASRHKIAHHLGLEIDRAFREEGIEIAFPRQDVHLRSVPPTGGSAADPKPEP